MCTVSVLPGDDGFRLMSNRDERRNRAVASPPAVRLVGARSVVMPVDPVGGGSWIGVNDNGLVAAVLNRHAAPAWQARAFMSRGLLVPRVLACGSIAAAIASARTLEPAAFRPFSLLLVHHQSIALLGGNGSEFAIAESTLDRPFMFTASSLGDVFVDSPRRRLFDCLMQDAGARWRNQELFHRHQWIDKRDISVLVDRAEAATVSRTMVDVSTRGAVLQYESLVPARPVQRVELPSC